MRTSLTDKVNFLRQQLVAQMIQHKVSADVAKTQIENKDYPQQNVTSSDIELALTPFFIKNMDFLIELGLHATHALTVINAKSESQLIMLNIEEIRLVLLVFMKQFFMVKDPCPRLAVSVLEIIIDNEKDSPWVDAAFASTLRYTFKGSDIKAHYFFNYFQEICDALLGLTTYLGLSPVDAFQVIEDTASRKKIAFLPLDARTQERAIREFIDEFVVGKNNSAAATQTELNIILSGNLQNSTYSNAQALYNAFAGANIKPAYLANYFSAIFTPHSNLTNPTHANSTRLYFETLPPVKALAQQPRLYVDNSSVFSKKILMETPLMLALSAISALIIWGCYQIQSRGRTGFFKQENKSIARVQNNAAQKMRVSP